MTLIPPEQIGVTVAMFSAVAVVGLTWVFMPAISTAIAVDRTCKTRSIGDKAGVETSPPVLTVVIPAFDEAGRLPKMLRDGHNYLCTQKGQDLLQKLKKCSLYLYPELKVNGVEWVVIDDGSRDETVRVTESTVIAMRSSHDWRVSSLSSNSGKGAAVKVGMKKARAPFLLMADADGATSFGPGLENLIMALESQLNTDPSKKKKSGMIAIFGSRAHLQSESSAKRSRVRSFLMHAFHFCVSLLVSSRIQDTQCGFKLFTKCSASKIFSALHLRRWAFDTEIVLICEQASIKICEVGVPWQEVDGSKLSTSRLALALNSILMLRDMICVRACYAFGIWKI